MVTAYQLACGECKLININNQGITIFMAALPYHILYKRFPVKPGMTGRSKLGMTGRSKLGMRGRSKLGMTGRSMLGMT